MFDTKGFDIFNTIITILIGLITVYLVRFYMKVYSLPKGPFPLPIIGNILLFRGSKVNQFVTINELHEKYGSVFTIWFGTTPAVVIGDYQLIKALFNSGKNELMGRPDTGIRKVFLQNGTDVVLSDHGPAQASLRKVAHMAVRKLAINDSFGYLIDDVVNEMVDTIIKKEGINKAFNPFHYLYMAIFNIIASSAFGKRYSSDDEELMFYERSFEFFRANNATLLLTDRVPIAKIFYSDINNKVSKTLEKLAANVRQKYLDRVKDHQKDVIRDFCDALIEAKEQAIVETKESAPHLNDINLSFVILNLFIAGSDTTQYMMRWIILLMANNIQMQIKMREEVESIIGDRIAVHEDRQNCHYINSFIAEALRFRGVAPLAVPHRAVCDYRFGNHFIAKDSFVFSNLLAISRDQSLWSNPEVFDPKRFLSSDNKFVSNITGFTPFGIGRRICLGEKLALEDLFLFIVRLLKSTSGHLIELPSGEGSANLEPNPNIVFFSTPNPFKIIIKKR